MENAENEMIISKLREFLSEEGIVQLEFYLTQENFQGDLMALLNAYQLGVKFQTSKKTYSQFKYKENHFSA